ncbi:MAG: potassium channel protein [Spirochaetota bacterium]|nr:potassium channel protein [Spirochaetota bacterium]
MDLQKIKITFSFLLLTILFGTISFHLVEGISLFNSLYMTIITISTVGFSEIKPLSTYGRIITIIIIATGITIGAYTIGTLLRMLIEGELSKTFGRRKLEKEIIRLKEHYIICGFGRIGSLICQELMNHNIQFVVIENDPASIEQLVMEKYLYIHMDATSDEAIMKAGIMKAKGIVPAVRSDADNVFITLTAKGLRPDIFILSRSSDEKSEIKLKRAGASKVVTPYLIGGKRMAQSLIRPTVVDFIDIAMMNNHLGLVMEEAQVQEGSPLIGKSLLDSNLKKDFGIIIVAIKKYHGEMIYNPKYSEILDINDVIVLIGKKEDLIRMNKIL